MTNTNTTTTPPPASPQPPKRKSWPRRHPIIAGAISVFVGGLAVIFALSAALSSAVNNAGVHAATPAHSAPAQPGSAPSSQPVPPPAPAGPAVLAVGDQLPVTQNGQDAGTVTVKSVQVTTAPADSEFGSA